MLKCLNVKTNRGMSLFLAVIIMSMLLAIALGISTILLSQIKMVRGIGDSVVAFFAADTGIENALYVQGSVSATLDNGASYSVSLAPPGPGCPASYYCLKSVGVFKGTKRAIEITR